MISRPVRLLLVPVLAQAVLTLPAVADAASLPQRTVLVSAGPAGAGAGVSAGPALSSTGRVVAYVTTASDLTGPTDPNGPTADVVVTDVATGGARLVSLAPGDPDGADGPSREPTISADGQTVVFSSDATDLVADDVNGVADVFVRIGGGDIKVVSMSSTGERANGPSGEPDVSADGRYVAFVSTATNLVPGDTNGEPDVFVKDLWGGEIHRASVSNDGAQAIGRSSSPAISADGSTVSFSSTASGLVPKDTNSVADVFVRDRVRNRTERVSIATSDRQQDKAVTEPFFPLSDLSEDGRYVVFDTDATSLYAQDTNRRTDVYLRDRREGTTTLVSASSLNVQGNNDSFAPRVSPNGRFVAFTSFASNLAPDDVAGEDVFLRDLRQGTTSVVGVSSKGSPRAAETSKLLQRPSIADAGRVVGFTSTAGNLADGDANGSADVFLRDLDAPVGRIVSKPAMGRKGTVVVAADDPLATRHLCQVDDQTPFFCGARIPVRKGMGALLRIRAGGAGMLFDPTPVTVRLSRDRSGPKVRITAPTGGSLRVLRGQASDPSGIRGVEVGFVYVSTKTGCRYLQSAKRLSRTSSRQNCFVVKFLPATGTTRWRLRLPRTIKGPYAIYARATDRIGNRSRTVVRKGVLR